jgi:cell wall-associated NlpC family hydrolase
MQSWSSSKVEISDLEEGDLIEFYRAMETYSHWAVYIGKYLFNIYTRRLFIIHSFLITY